MENVCFECSLMASAFHFDSDSITVIGLIHAALSTLHDRFKSGALCNAYKKKPSYSNNRGLPQGPSPRRQSKEIRSLAHVATRSVISPDDLSKFSCFQY
jgi:hypothetical protein